MSPNDADGMANSVYPDQTAPLGAVWSGSALFAQAYLSENLGSLRYGYEKKIFVPLHDLLKNLNVVGFSLWDWSRFGVESRKPEIAL